MHGNGVLEYLEGPTGLVWDNEVSKRLRIRRANSRSGRSVTLGEGPHHAGRRLKNAQQRVGDPPACVSEIRQSMVRGNVDKAEHDSSSSPAINQDSFVYNIRTRAPLHGKAQTNTTAARLPSRLYVHVLLQSEIRPWWRRREIDTA